MTLNFSFSFLFLFFFFFWLLIPGSVVAVHGLEGHADNTWTHSSSRKLWLRDFLPNSNVMKNNVRIMTFGYDARAFKRPFDSRPGGRIFVIAEQLLNDLSDRRSKRDVSLVKRFISGPYKLMILRSGRVRACCIYWSFSWGNCY